MVSGISASKKLYSDIFQRGQDRISGERVISVPSIAACMKVCIPSQSPGGPDAVVSAPFEESEFLDYYEIHEDGNFDHEAQMRSCLGGCSDPVEAITRRGVEAVVVTGISPRSLMLFRNAGIKVLRADSPAVRSLIDSLVTGTLLEIGIDEFAAQRRTK